jgi:hypothetical protein
VMIFFMILPLIIGQTTGRRHSIRQAIRIVQFSKLSGTPVNP